MSETKTTEPKQNGFAKFGKGIAKFFRDGRAEVKKIIWPKPSTVFKNSGIVLLIIVVLGAFIFGLDTLLWWLLRFIMDVA
mgnify:CR=1 FL=1